MIPDFVDMFPQNPVDQSFSHRYFFRYLVGCVPHRRFAQSLPLEESIRELRIHPSIHSCIVSLRRLTINSKEANYTITGGNFDDRHNNVFLFFRDRPYIQISSEEVITSVEAELVVDSGSFTYARLNAAWVAKILQKRTNERSLLKRNQEKAQEEQNKLKEKNAALIQRRDALKEALNKQREKNAALIQRRNALEEALNKQRENTKMVKEQNTDLIYERDALKAALSAQRRKNKRLKADYTALINSFSWKITAPLRMLSFKTRPK